MRDFFIQLVAAALTLVLCFVFILAMGVMSGLLWPSFYQSWIGKHLILYGSIVLFYYGYRLHEDK